MADIKSLCSEAKHAMRVSAAAFSERDHPLQL
jgi:hypothetical protein